MMRLRRVYETAEEEGRPIEEVAVERFGSLEAFEQAREERRILDEREGGERRGREAGGDRKRQGQFGKGGERGFMFNDPGSGASSRSQSFRRPAGSGPSTPSAGPSTLNRPKYDSMRISTSGQSTSTTAHTPVPSVLTPQTLPSTSTKRAISPSSLNKLQAKVLRAKLMGAPDAEAKYRVAVQQAQTEDANARRFPSLYVSSIFVAVPLIRSERPEYRRFMGPLPVIGTRYDLCAFKTPFHLFTSHE